MIATPQPTTDAIRQKAAEIVAGRDFSLDESRPDHSWLVKLAFEILDWIVAPFKWVYTMTQGLPGLLQWTIILGLAVILMLLIWHIGYTLIYALRGTRRMTEGEQASRRSSTDPADLERLASQAALDSNFVGAIRFLFRAAVIRLERVEKRTNRPGTTNRELLRRYRDKPTCREPLERMVDMIDRKWYGDEQCSDADYVQCQTDHRELCRVISEFEHAVSA